MKAVETVETVSDSGERVIFFSFSMISSSLFSFFSFLFFWVALIREVPPALPASP